MTNHLIVIVYSKGINKRITNEINCCCLHKVVKSGTQNSALNKEFELKLNAKFIFISLTKIYFKRF